MEAILVGECLQRVKEPTNKLDKNAVAVACTNSHCKGKVVGDVQQKSPWLYPYFYPCPIVLWTSLLLRNASTMEKTDWKSQRILMIMYPKRLLHCLKNKITKIEESLHETAKHSPKWNTWKLLAKNVFYGLLLSVYYKEVSSRG